MGHIGTCFHHRYPLKPLPIHLVSRLRQQEQQPEHGDEDKDQHESSELEGEESEEGSSDESPKPDHESEDHVDDMPCPENSRDEASDGEGSSDSEKTLPLPGGGVGDTQTYVASPETDQDSETSDGNDVQDLCTPEPKSVGEWREELFTTPQFGNSGPRHDDIMEMCIGLMQFFGTQHPDIAKFLSCSSCYCKFLLSCLGFDLPASTSFTWFFSEFACFKF